MSEATTESNKLEILQATFIILLTASILVTAKQYMGQSQLKKSQF